MSDRPEIVTDEHIAFLCDLRDLHNCNMLTSAAYIENRFKLSRSDADIIVKYWTDSFESHLDAEAVT